MSKRLRILLSAYSCRPNAASEPWIGWTWATELAKTHTVFVITRAKYKEHILKEIKDSGIDNLHFIFVDANRVVLKFKKGTIGIIIYYYIWQILAFFTARKIYKSLNIDLIHHVTFINSWMPSFLSFLPTPFIWGPVGQHPRMPAILFGSLPVKYRLIDLLKAALKWTVRHLDPFYRLTVRKSRKILVTHRYNMALFPEREHHKIDVMPGICYDSKRYDSNKSARTNILKNGHIRLVTAGRLEYWKGFHIAVDVFREYNKSNPNSSLSIIGSGMLEKWLAEYIGKSGLSDRISLIPPMDKSAFLHYLDGFDVFLYPNIGTDPLVLLDATAAGLTVVCLKFPGAYEFLHSPPHIFVDIAARYNDTVAALSQGIESAVMQNHSCANYTYSNYLDMEKKIEEIEKIYQKALN